MSKYAIKEKWINETVYFYLKCLESRLRTRGFICQYYIRMSTYREQEGMMGKGSGQRGRQDEMVSAS